FQDRKGNRGTIEIRITPEGYWYLDTFLYNSKVDSGLTLRDSTNLHLLGEWYWVSLEYDGKTMSQYVNGRKELENKIIFNPMKSGHISIGVRFNHKHWYRGRVKEIYFYPGVIRGAKTRD